MSHLDRISANNAFWREMLDQIPATILIFRIDDADQAQLFFVNTHIKTDLGFTSEEYVLGSESSGQVAEELNGLIDKIAALSHKEHEPDSGFTAQLTSRDGISYPFRFEFKIFQSKVSRINLISVSLFKQTADNSSSLLKESSKPVQKSVMQPIFVSESPIMTAVVDKVDQTAHHDSHLIIHGEPHTGKKTMLKRLLNTLRMTSSGFKMLQADISTEGPEKALPELFSGLADAKIHALSQYREDMILAISDVHKLKREQMDRIVGLLDYRSRIGLKTRVLLTSESSMEALSEQGKISQDMIYKYVFISIPVPPLRHRKEDISIIARKWSAKLCHTLDLPPVEFTDAQLFQLEEHPWPENFKSLYENLRFAVLSSKNGRPDIRIQHGASKPSKKNKQETPDFTIEPEKIVSFDDMNRQYLQHVLKITNGKIYGENGAAELLKLKPTTLQSKLKKLKVR